MLSNPVEVRNSAPPVHNDLVAVLQVAVTPGADAAKLRGISKQFVTGGDVDGVSIEGDAAQSAVPAAALPVYVGFVPVDGLHHGLILRIDQVNASVALPLLAAANDGSRYKFQGS